MSTQISSSWLEKVRELFGTDTPRSREELVALLHEAVQRGIIKADVERMLERVLHVGELRVRDVMVPRSKMDVVEAEAPLHEVLEQVVTEGHSRYPVVGPDPENEGRETVLGILMTKDILRALVRGELQDEAGLRALYREPTLVPESKRLNDMLGEFKSGRAHLAVVVDEYGEYSGLVTIEDVLEEIVGEIEDEYDEIESYVRRRKGYMLVDAHMPLDEFNRYFQTSLSCPQVETIGGCIVSRLGHIPEVGERLQLAEFDVEVTQSDGRRLREIRLNIPGEAAPERHESSGAERDDVTDQA